MIDSPFPNNSTAHGATFLGRVNSVRQLAKLMSEHKNALIYDAPKTGKRSLVMQAVSTVNSEWKLPLLLTVNLMNVRTVHQLITILGTVFEETGLEHSRIYPEEQSSDDLEARLTYLLAELPFRLGYEKSVNVIVYFEEFQNLLLFDDPDSVMKLLETIMTPVEDISYVISGSQINKMKYIFEEVKYFYHFATRIELPRIEYPRMEEYMIMMFRRAGNVVDEAILKDVYDTMDAHPWYVWCLADLCLQQTPGYLNRNVFNNAVEMLLGIHESKFKSLVNSLSSLQTNMLYAVFNGVSKFNTVAIRERYGLNSSANVTRMKDALKKKELVVFEKDGARIIDPLFRLWLQRRYFIQPLFSPRIF